MFERSAEGARVVALQRVLYTLQRHLHLQAIDSLEHSR